MSKRKIFLILTVITSIGFLLRLFFIFHRGPFWFDEVWSVHFSSLPWTEAVRYWVIETNPFLHTLFMRGIVSVFGSGELPSRIFSLLIGTACIPLTYILARSFSYRRRTAMIAAALIALSQSHVFISSEARGYALLCFLTIISFILLARITSGRSQSWKTISAYGISVVLLLFTHLTAIALAPIHILMLSLTYRDRQITLETVKKVILMYGISAALFLAWLIPSLVEKANSAIFNAWFFSPSNTYAGNLVQSIANLFLARDLNSLGWLIFGILIITAFVYFISRIPKDKKTTTFSITLLASALFPPIIAACFGQNDPKFFGYSLPAIVIILATLNEYIPDAKIRTAYYTILLIIPLIASFSLITGSIFDPAPILRFLNGRTTPQSAIFITPFNEILTWQRYYHGEAKLIPAYPIDDNLSFDERIARYNWQKLPIGGEDLIKWYEDDANVSQYEKIFYITPYDNPEVAVTTLLQMGWRYGGHNEDPDAVNRYINYFVYELLPPITTTTPQTNLKPNKSK